MLKLFGRRKRKDSGPPKPERLKDLQWPLTAILKLRLNPVRGRRFFHRIICMAAKMATVDAPVNEAELLLYMELLEREFALSAKQRRYARQILFEAHRSQKTFDEFAHEFAKEFRKEPALLLNAFDVLMAMALVDDRFTLAEQRIIASAAVHFGIDESAVEQVRARYAGRTAIIETEADEARRRAQQRTQRRHSNAHEQRDHERDRGGERAHAGAGESHSQGQKRQEPPPTRQRTTNWWTVLGVGKDDSERIVKKRYRKLAFEFHPDRLSGIPDEMKRASAERFIEIRNAWEEYLRVRG